MTMVLLVQLSRSNSLHTYVMLSDIGTHEWPMTTYAAFFNLLCALYRIVLLSTTVAVNRNVYFFSN